MTNPPIAFSDTVTGVLTDGILTVTLHNPPVNAIGQDMRRGLLAALARVAADDAIAAAILTGAGHHFIGGADIREFNQPPLEPHLPPLVESLEQSAKPILAALNGATLGGGLEVALACHARIAQSGIKLGLPEVKLGLVPGAGGTQRLPRLTGLIAAIELIATGRIIPAEEALDLAICDQVAPAGLLDAARSLAREMMIAPRSRTGMRQPRAVDEAALDAAAAAVLAKTRGQQAPAEAIRLVRLAARLPLAEGLIEERATFLRLRDSAQSAALRHVFFAERAAAKIEGLQGVTPRNITRIGIVGLGLMGSGIAMAALSAGFAVIGIDQTPQAADKGRAAVLSLLARAVAKGRLSATAQDACCQRFTTASDLGPLAAADLVIEAVFDDLALKMPLFAQLDAITAPSAILATNTSYLDPEQLAGVTRHPERVAGLHFFSPAHVMRLAEVVACAKTAPEVLASLLLVARRMGKLPIVTGVCEGFIGNRLFSAYRREAELLLEEGASPATIDAAMEAYGMSMGPFATFDLTGLEIAWMRRKRAAATRDPAAHYVDIADRLCEAGRFGQKTQRGWYRYAQGQRESDPEVTLLIEAARTAAGITARTITPDEITHRLITAMAREGERLLEEGIAMRASDIDLVMINGYGFPAWRGGPMFARAL